MLHIIKTCTVRLQSTLPHYSSSLCSKCTCMWLCQYLALPCTRLHTLACARAVPCTNACAMVSYANMPSVGEWRTVSYPSGPACCSLFKQEKHCISEKVYKMEAVPGSKLEVY